jgi:hypothetical protein
MDRNHSPEVSAEWAAICKRHGGRRVGSDQATFAAGQPARPSARDALAHGSEHDLLHRPELLPVAHAAEGVSAIHDGAALLLPLARSDAAKGFQPLPRRWVVERTIAWLNRNRRLAKDFEATIESAQAWLFIASVKLPSRRIARRSAATRWQQSHRQQGQCNSVTGAEGGVASPHSPSIDFPDHNQSTSLCTTRFVLA